MPTLSFEGSVYLSTAAGDRRELVVIAPSYTVDATLNRIQTAISAADDHEINFTDLPGNKATGILLSLSEGEVDLVLTDDDSVVSTYHLTTGGMVMMMNTLIANIVVTATVDSIYDMIVTGTEEEV